MEQVNNVLLTHNKNLYEQVKEKLNNNNKALVVLGTVLGKTTTALQYLIDNNCRGLVIVPNMLIKNGWDNYEQVDTITYQSFANRYKNMDFSQYGLIILDEAHHVGYNEESKIGAKVWSKGIRYILNKGYKVLGLTATPDRNDGIKLEKELFKDSICEGYSVEDGIEKGIIHPFSYVTAIYNTSGLINEMKEKYYNEKDEESKKLFGQLDLVINNTPTLKEIFDKYMPKDSKRKGIIFIQEINDKEYVLDLFNQIYPNIDFRTIDSKMDKLKVQENRNWFENTDEGYLIAVNMISEGAHYKGVNTIIMFRKTESYLLYTQQLGRIMTLTKDKNPNGIVFDLVNNIDNVSIKEKEFKGQQLKKHNVSNIINSLKNLKSNQIIIADETQDIIKKLKEIKKYNDYWWSEEDIQFLKDNYGKKSYREISKLLNNKYSYDGVKSKALDLGITKSSTRQIWTEEDIQILKDNYYEKSYKEEMINLLNNKFNGDSIRKKAKRLGLKTKIYLKDKYFQSSWTEEEIQILKDNYNKKSIKEIVKLLNNKHTYDGVKAQARKIKITISRYWNDEDIQILKDNYGKKTYYEICDLLNNKYGYSKYTYNQVSHKASSLKIIIPRKKTKESDK